MSRFKKSEDICHILATVLQELSRGRNLDLPSWLGDPARVLELALAILSAEQPVEERGR